MSNIINNFVAIRDNAVEVQFLRRCEDGYLEWYIIVSHPHPTPLARPADDVKPSLEEGPLDDMPSPPPSMTDQ